MSDTKQQDLPQGKDEVLARLLKEAGPRPSVSPQRAARVEAVVRETWRHESRARRRRRTVLWAVASFATAAAVLLGVGAVLRGPAASLPVVPVATIETVLGTVRSGESATTVGVGETLFSGVDLVTGSAGRAALRLASGLSLRLDRNTRVRVDSPRSVFLERGALYVDSGADPDTGRSIEIQTSLGTARDVGTQFEVRLEGDDLVVRVREGLVELSHEGRLRDAPAGQETRMSRGGDLERRSLLSHGPEWAWIAEAAPPFPLEGSSLEDFADWIAREAGWTVRFEQRVVEESASTIVLEGPPLQMMPEQALRTVLPTCGLAYRLEGGDLWIIDPARTGGQP